MRKGTRRRTTTPSPAQASPASASIPPSPTSDPFFTRRKVLEWAAAGVLGNAVSDILKGAVRLPDGRLSFDPKMVEAALNRRYEVSVRLSETIFHRFAVVLEHTGQTYLIKALHDLGSSRVSTACAERYEAYVLLGTIIMSEHNLIFDFDFSNIKWPGESDLVLDTASI